MSQIVSNYSSPLGGIVLAADEEGLTGLWFEGQKYFGGGLSEGASEEETEIIRSAKRWLDIYFSGREPDFMPPLHLTGTLFRCAVWKRLMEIPYGETTTYGEIAKELSAGGGTEKMSAQAVGGGCRSQSGQHYCSLSQSCGKQRAAHRICRRTGAETLPSGTGTASEVMK